MSPISTIRLAALTLTLAIYTAHAQSSDPSVNDVQKQIRALKWVHGPQRVELYGKSALDLPAGYMFLNPADTAKFQTLTHNLGGGQQYFLAPEDFSWESLFSFQEDGYVKDEETINADAILANIKKATVAANEERRSRGWNEMEVTGWQTPPHYDTSTRQLEWSIEGRDVKTGERAVNFNTRILGRGGVMSVVLLTDPQQFTAVIPSFKRTLEGFSYDPGQRYAEYKSGDKVAKYGLAALITGGAAAIAVKTGFWKVIVGALAAGWKFILAGCVALSGVIKKFFKRDKA